MKILAIGDFHGKFPSKLERRIHEENPDLILSVGDYPDTTALRDLEFKYWKQIRSGSDFADLIGKSKYRTLLKNTLISISTILKKLNSFGIPVVTIYGNSDAQNKEAKDYNLNGIESQCKKLGFKLLRHRKARFDGFDILGFSGYRGAQSKGLTEIDDKKRVRRFNAKWKKEMGKTLGMMRNPERTIFVAHDVPYGYFDKVLLKYSPMYQKHLGDIYALNCIRKYQPALYICGHMHEYQGIKRIGKTRVVAVGPAYEGKAAIINYPEMKIRFIK